MAHMRERYLTDALEKALKWSPTVSVIGMRQTGKTTLLKQIARTYLTLDDDRLLGDFERSQWLALEKSSTPIAIDECQKLPKIFDRVKYYVDERKQMGRFILTGSVRFLLKRQIRESLTGRTAILELLPFIISEAHERPLNSSILEVLSMNFLRSTKHIEAWFQIRNREHWLSQNLLLDHLNRGGLPGIAFRRDPKVRSQLFRVHLDTLLNRDILFLTQTRLSGEKLRNLYRELCLTQGLTINESELARKTGMTHPTVSKMIDVFAALFLVRRHGRTLYCEDGGLAEYAMGGQLLSAQQLLKAFVFRELTGKIHYAHLGLAELSSFWTRGGAEVPFVWSSRTGEQLGITVDAESDPGEKSIRSLESFLHAKKDARGPVRAIAFHQGKDRYIARKGIVCLPLADLV